jgi:hypothetical protein
MKFNEQRKKKQEAKGAGIVRKRQQQTRFMARENKILEVAL